MTIMNFTKPCTASANAALMALRSPSMASQMRRQQQQREVQGAAAQGLAATTPNLPGAAA
jgi:hypothetical protein